MGQNKCKTDGQSDTQVGPISRENCNFDMYVCESVRIWKYPIHIFPATLKFFKNDFLLHDQSKKL